MQPHSSCPDYRTLSAFLVGDVPEAEAEQLQQHVASCAACSRTARAPQPSDPFVTVLRASTASVNESTQVDTGLLNRLRRLVHEAREDSAGQRDSRDADDFLEPPQRAGELGRFGPYRVLERLGRGAMGIVYLARQERPDRLVALKVLAGAPVATGRRLARFRAETDVISSLRHANVVHVYEAGEHAGLPYYTMEHLEGGSLAQKLAASPLSARDAAALVKTLAEAIQLAHERHIIHRDLKPSNILLAADGTPKIADFGLAKHLQEEKDGRSETETGAILGTPGYMAPEQSAGGDIGPSVDVYALGAILYEALTGRPPFKGATPLDTLQQARNDDPVPPAQLQRGVPRDLQAVCLKCLEKSPKNRYAAARELADDLGRFLRGEPTRARPLGFVGRSMKWARRRPALAALAAVCLLGVIAGTSGVLVHNARLSQEVQRAEASEVRAEQEQERMAVQYQAARSALNQILEQLQSSPSADLPRLKELRRKVLEQTLAFYEASVRDESDLPPAMLRDLAVAYHRISWIQWQLGDAAAARRNVQESLRLSEKLVALDPRNAEYQDCVARDCMAIASFVADSGAPPKESERIAFFRKAIAIYEGLLERQPDNPLWRQNLATAYHDLAGVSFAAARLPEARTLYRRAIEIRRRAIAQRPGEAAYRVALAEDQLSLGLIESHLQHTQPAEKAYQDADRLLKELIRNDPQNDGYPAVLAALYVNWAFLMGGEGQQRRVLPLLGEGIQRLSPVLEREPSDQAVRERLLNLHGARAQAYESSQRFADAVSDWERVVALENHPGLQALRRAGLANALARAGVHERAATETSKLAAMPEVKGDMLYNAACIFALCIRAVGNDARLSSRIRADLNERYASQALACLEKLRAERYFTDRKRMELLKQDADLQTLRQRTDFQKFLRQIDGS